MVPLSLSIRGLSLTALLIGIGCDSAERRVPLSSHTLHENSDASSGQSLSQYSAPTESPIANSEPSITVELPTPDKPVTAAMFCENASDKTDPVTLKVWIKVLIARGHYIYAPSDAGGPFRTLSVNLKTPSTATNEEDWQFPSSNAMNGHAVYYDSVVMHRQLRLSDETVSELDATVQFQVCNEDVCYPPAKLQLTSSIGRSP